MKKRTIFANEVLLYAWIACHVLFLSAGFLYGGFMSRYMDDASTNMLYRDRLLRDRWCLMLIFDRDGVLYKPLFRMRIQYSINPYEMQYAYTYARQHVRRL